MNVQIWHNLASSHPKTPFPPDIQADIQVGLQKDKNNIGYILLITIA